MILPILTLIAAICGHVYLVVLFINYVHATGLRERSLKALFGFSLAFLAGVPIIYLIEHLYSPLGVGIRSGPLAAYAACCVLAGGLLTPGVTLIRGLRKPPAGTSQSSRTIDLRDEHPERRFHGEGFGARLIGLRGNDTLKLRLVECSIEIPGLPADLSGLTFLQISDLHFSTAYDRSYFELIAEIAASRTADYVLFTGDLIDDERCIEWIEPFFSRVQGLSGSYCILGNHDYEKNPEAIRGELARSGFDDVEGAWRTIKIGSATLALGGTCEPWGRKIDLSSKPKSHITILLSHSPDVLPKVAGSGIDFMLAGHNHGGQIRFPAIGPVLMPSRYSRRFDRGFFRQKSTLLYVSEGIGGRHPYRVGCVPEIARFTLVPEASRARRAAARDDAATLVQA